MTNTKTKYTAFGLEVKKAMLEKGVTQEQLEKELDIPKKMVSKIVCGETPGRKHIPKITQYLDMEDINAWMIY